MNELETPVKVKHDTQLVAQINKEYTLKGSIVKRPVLTLFAVDPYNLTAERVIVKSKAILSIKGKVKTENRAEYQKDKIYMQALNKENAIRKVKQIINKINVG